MKKMGALLSVFSALSACGGGGSSPAPKPTPPPPPPLTYTVGGNISGLNGTLVLQNNGGDDLSLNGNGAFAFATALATGANYNVIVKTQPTSPAQNCAVSNGTGAIASGNVTSVNIVCANDPAWSVPALIETDDAGNASKPQIAIDRSGNAIAVWQQSDGTHNKIWFNRFTAASGWGTAAQLEPTGIFDANSPDIAIDDDGNAIAVWTQTDSISFNVWWSRYSPSSGFSVPAQLSSSDHAGAAQVAMNGAGDAVVVWTQSSPSQTIARRYSIGSGWGAVTQLQTSFNFASLSPQAAMDQNGNATVVWAQSDGTRYHLWANRLTSGTWGIAQMVENSTSGPSVPLFPQVAMDASGNAIAVWTQNDGTRFNLWANRLDAGGWGVPAMLEIDDGTAADPQIAMDATGNAVAVWNQYGATVANIASARYLVGQGWTPAALIENDDDGAALYPQLAMTPTGTAQVVWQQYRDGSRYDIYANRYRPDHGWDTAKLIGNEDTGASHSATTPQIAISADGTAQALWLRNDGTRVNVWSARFE